MRHGLPSALRDRAARLLALLGVLLGSIAVLVAAPTGATAAAPTNCEYPASSCGCPSLSVSTTVPQGGESVDVTGDHFRPGVRSTIFLVPIGKATPDHRVNLKTVRTKDDGTFATTVTIPQRAEGKFDLLATNGTPTSATTDAGISCPADPTVRLQVAALAERNPSDNTNEPATAFTGTNLLWLVLLAAALIVVGAYAVRRGRQQDVVRSIHG